MGQFNSKYQPLSCVGALLPLVAMAKFWILSAKNGRHVRFTVRCVSISAAQTLWKVFANTPIFEAMHQSKFDVRKFWLFPADSVVSNSSVTQQFYYFRKEDAHSWPSRPSKLEKWGEPILLECARTSTVLTPVISLEPPSRKNLPVCLERTIKAL